ncbi:uncharacterized protein B0H64DRAFT_114846 [Chaetomium fimeti]|uniref:Uncharacterized protein n=1 Tax=Chaetomium fimeti TaxID=1854472 RepID=A0AAE0HIA8_9PEZI|nr:hypothetical protein B0H64DRAFT_114846 [Chaetomium fimeti]
MQRRCCSSSSPHAGAALGHRSGVIQQGKAAAQPPHGQGWGIESELKPQRKRRGSTISAWLWRQQNRTSGRLERAEASAFTGRSHYLSIMVADVVQQFIGEQFGAYMLVEPDVERKEALLRHHATSSCVRDWMGSRWASKGHLTFWFRPVEADDEEEILAFRRTEKYASSGSRFSCSNRNPQLALPETSTVLSMRDPQSGKNSAGEPAMSYLPTILTRQKINRWRRRSIQVPILARTKPVGSPTAPPPGSNCNPFSRSPERLPRQTGITDHNHECRTAGRYHQAVFDLGCAESVTEKLWATIGLCPGPSPADPTDRAVVCRNASLPSPHGQHSTRQLETH